jgi:hypothetical protein
VDDYFDEYNDHDSEGNDLLDLSDQEAWEDMVADMREFDDPEDPEDCHLDQAFEDRYAYDEY